MKDHRDSSKGERGRLYAPDAVFRLPVYLDGAGGAPSRRQRGSAGGELCERGNELLTHEIEMIEAVK